MIEATPVEYADQSASPGGELVGHAPEIRTIPVDMLAAIIGDGFEWVGEDDLFIRTIISPVEHIFTHQYRVMTDDQWDRVLGNELSGIDWVLFCRALVDAARNHHAVDGI